MADKRYEEESADYRRGFVEGQTGERDAYLLLTGCADAEEYERGFNDGQSTMSEPADKSPEFKVTQYHDPDQTSGQHTNGPANIFVREDDSCPWYLVDRGFSFHRARGTIKEIGLREFQSKHCARIMD